MAVEESSPAIVLRTRDYAEADRVVTVLTRDFGKLSGIAKGAKASRKRFERKLEPLTPVMLYFKRRPLGQLVFITRAEPSAQGYPPLDDDLAKLALGSYMVEMADALTTEEAEARGAFAVLEAGLRTLAEGRASRVLRHRYEIRMLQAAGYGLDVERCRLCEQACDAAVYFVIARGGIVCQRCRPEAPEGAVRLDAASAMALRRMNGAEWSSWEVSCSEAIAMALGRFLNSILDRKLRSAEFLESVLE